MKDAAGFDGDGFRESPLQANKRFKTNDGEMLQLSRITGTSSSTGKNPN